MWTLRDGLLLAKDMNLSNLLVDMDSSSVVSLINALTDNLHPFSDLICDCRTLMSQCFVSEIQFVHWEADKSADLLAKNAFNMNSSVLLSC